LSPRILLLTRHCQDAATIGRALAEVGAEPQQCPDLASLVAALHDDVAAAVAIEEELAGTALEALRDWIAAQPNWSDLPILVLGAPPPPAMSRSTLLGSLGSAVLLERPLGGEALLSAVRVALRQRRRQRRFGQEAAALRGLNSLLESRAAERASALQESELRFRSYFQNFPEPLFVLDVAGGDIHYADLNPESERALGLRRADVAGKAPSEILPADTADRMMAECRRCVALGQTHRFTVTAALKGEMRVFDVALAPLHDGAGQVIRLLGAARDVTQQRAMEERLRQAQKLETLSQLTGGVAHDFNNLLQVLTSGLTLLERTDDPARRIKLFEPLQQTIQRGADLVRRLLAFSQRQSLRAEPIDLGAWLDAHVHDLLSRALRGNILVRKRVAADIPLVEVDTAELELTLLNLALNARDAMPGGGELLIEVEAEHRTAALDPDGLDGEFVRLSVTDSGMGMGPVVQARLFEPFFTTKPPGQGIGLGLAQVYGFVRQSGGVVRVRSETGRGTTVSILLPACDHFPPDIAATPHQTPVRVLLCEDDEAVAVVAAQLLAQLGHSSKRVPTAAEALAVLEAGTPVDLLLTDILMPGNMDGATLAREAARRRPGLPVLLMTGFEGDTEITGLAVLRKPYRIEQLASAIAAAMARVMAPPRPG